MLHVNRSVTSQRLKSKIIPSLAGVVPTIFMSASVNRPFFSSCPVTRNNGGDKNAFSEKNQI